MNKKEIIEFVPIDGKLYISLENANKSIDIMQKRIEKQKEVIDNVNKLLQQEQDAMTTKFHYDIVGLINALLDILNEGKNEWDMETYKRFWKYIWNI